jgi:hypothetical protein
MFDEDGNGFITNDELVTLVNVLHPRDIGRASRALKELDMEEAGGGRIKVFFVHKLEKLPNQNSHQVVSLPSFVIPVIYAV